MVQSKQIESDEIFLGHIDKTLNQILYQATHWNLIDISASIYYVPRNLIYRLMHEFYAITGNHLNINVDLDDHKRTRFRLFFYNKYQDSSYVLITIQNIDPTSKQFVTPCFIDEDREKKIKQVIIALTKYLGYTNREANKVSFIQRIINFFRRR